MPKEERKQITHELTFEFSKLFQGEAHQALENVATWVQAQEDEGYRSIMFQIENDWDSYGGHSLSVTASGTRDESDRELQERIKAREAREKVRATAKASVEKRERTLYKRLKEKYGDSNE